MRRKKCPYCGKRVSYVSSFFCRRKAEYVCPRCGKESRVVINRFVILVFVIFALLAVAVMIGWILAGMSNNPLGIAAVALPLVLFALISPTFVVYEPLKKYKKSMEARKAGIEYSDNLSVSELETEKSSFSGDTTGGFHMNNDLFNKIKAERTAAKEQLNEHELVSDSGELEEEKKESYVHVINNVSEGHAKADAPLRKINRDRQISRSRHYINRSDD